MLQFKRYRAGKGVDGNGSLVKLRQQWRNIKVRMALQLQQQSELLPVNTRKYLLLLFCVLFGGSSVMIILKSTASKTNAVSIKRIGKATQIERANEQRIKPDSIITNREYEKTRLFKQYLLQLRNDPAGKARFDSIVQHRPHLLDSMDLLEKMYLSQ